MLASGPKKLEGNANDVRGAPVRRRNAGDGEARARGHATDEEDDALTKMQTKKSPRRSGGQVDRGDARSAVPVAALGEKPLRGEWVRGKRTVSCARPRSLDSIRGVRLNNMMQINYFRLIDGTPKF